jgi:hypothetical protein
MVCLLQVSDECANYDRDPEGTPGPSTPAGPCGACSRIVEAARLAVDRAERALDHLARLPTWRSRAAQKTVASDDETTLSGWKGHPSGFVRVSPEEVREVATNIGHVLHPDAARDQPDAAGYFPGRARASHAEKQLALLVPGMPIGVSKPLCDDCRAFLRALAQAKAESIVVGDIDDCWIFQPTGMVQQIAW